MELHQDDTTLWARMMERAGSTGLTKYIFAFVLELVTRLFRTPIPAPLQGWTKETTSLAVRVWLDAFAVDWAISDWPGSLTNLLLAADFIPERSLRIQYCRSRLFPRKSHASMGAVVTSSRNMFLKYQTTRLSYLAHRAAVHLKDMASLPMQHLRWKRALYLWSEDSRRT